MIIGIDPDKGIAVKRNGKIDFCKTVPGIIEMRAWLKNVRKLSHVDKIVIELPANKKVYHRPDNSVYAMQKIAVNVGENRRKAQELVEFCRELGFNVAFRRPTVGGKKITATMFKQLTGYKKRTSQHARDAALLIL